MKKNKKEESNLLSGYTQHSELLMNALLLSGKMAVASRLVINSTAKDLSDNIKTLEKCVDEYDEIIFKYHNETFNSS